MLPKGVGFRLVHEHGVCGNRLFPLCSATFALQNIRGYVTGRAEQPTGQRSDVDQMMGFASEEDEHSLTNVIRQICAPHFSQTATMSQIDVSMDNLAKGTFRTILDVLSQQDMVIHSWFYLYYGRHSANVTEKLIPSAGL